MARGNYARVEIDSFGSRHPVLRFAALLGAVSVGVGFIERGSPFLGMAINSMALVGYGLARGSEESLEFANHVIDDNAAKAQRELAETRETAYSEGLRVQAAIDRGETY